MKKIALSFFFSIISFNAMAEPAHFPRGLFLGLAGGFSHTDTSFNARATADANPATPFIFDNSNPSLNSGIIQGLVGYLHVFNAEPVTIGTEIFYSYSGIQKTFEPSSVYDATVGATASTSTTLKHQNEIGIKFLMGYIINNVNHPYITLGYSRNSYNSNNKVTYVDGGNLDKKTVKNDFSTNHFLVGAGFERGEGNIRYGIEGIYKIGQKTKIIQNDVFSTAAGDTIRASTDLKIKNSYMVMFKFTYNFNVFA